MSEIVIVTGGRDYLNYEKVCEILDELDIHAVVHGGFRILEIKE